MTILLTLRTVRTDWNFPVYLHVFGAMVLVGGLLAGTSSPRIPRAAILRSLRLGYFTLLTIGAPLCADAHRPPWIYSKEGWGPLPSGGTSRPGFPSGT